MLKRVLPNAPVDHIPANDRTCFRSPLPLHFIFSRKDLAKSRDCSVRTRTRFPLPFGDWMSDMASIFTYPGPIRYPKISEGNEFPGAIALRRDPPLVASYPMLSGFWHYLLS